MVIKGHKSPKIKKIMRSTAFGKITKLVKSHPVSPIRLDRIKIPLDLAPKNTQAVNFNNKVKLVQYDKVLGDKFSFKRF